jgi:hypothetical protein
VVNLSLEGRPRNIYIISFVQTRSLACLSLNFPLFPNPHSNRVSSTEYSPLFSILFWAFSNLYPRLQPFTLQARISYHHTGSIMTPLPLCRLAASLLWQARPTEPHQEIIDKSVETGAYQETTRKLLSCKCGTAERNLSILEDVEFRSACGGAVSLSAAPVDSVDSVDLNSNRSVPPFTARHSPESSYSRTEGSSGWQPELIN